MKSTKSRNKNRKDNETPEKCLSDDSRANMDELNNKINDQYSELKITKEALQELNRVSSSSKSNHDIYSPICVRRDLPPEKRAVPTKKYHVLRRAPDDTAVVRQMVLDNGGIKLDDAGRVVPHSILGTTEDFYRTALEKGQIQLKDIPGDYHHSLGFGSSRRPISAMFPGNVKEYDKENKISSRIGQMKTERKKNISKSKEASDTSALKLWQKRMKERRDLQDHISKKVARVPEKLVFNSGEVVRLEQELSHLISKSIPYYGYGYGFRNGSEFWNQNEEVGIDTKTMIHMSNTQTQKGYPPPITHIGVPSRIAKEKGVPSTTEGTRDKGSYFYQRYFELHDVIHELQPHFPLDDGLIVEGTQIQRPVSKEKSTKLDEKPVECKKVEKEEENDCKSFMDTKEITEMQPVDEPSFIIDSIRVPIENRDCDEIGEESRKFEIRKILSGYEKQITVEYLHLENTGCTVIRLWWKKADTYDPFNLDNKGVRRFYFDTEDIILLPKQQLDFPIIFKSENSGIFTEKWKLETAPLLTDKEGFEICFRGISLQQDVTQNIRQQIKDYIQLQVSSKICLSILDDIISFIHHRGTFEDYEEEEDEWMEEDIFCNANEGIPYNIDVLQMVRKIQTDLIGKEGGEENGWDLDCRQLRKAILNTEGLKTEKKEDKCEKFHRTMEKMMIVNLRPDISRFDQLYRICYSSLLQFGGKMFDDLKMLRNHHNLPEMELKISREKSKGQGNKSKSQPKASSKKQSLSSTSTSTKGKSREPTIITREPTELNLVDPDEVEKSTTNNNNNSYLNIDEGVEIDQTQNLVDTKLSSIQNTQLDIEANNLAKYNYKTHQIVQSLLYQTIDQVLDVWSSLV